MSKKIVLAGGCFWGMEDLIRKQPGVINTGALRIVAKKYKIS